MSKPIFTGAAVALVTPMHANGEVNYEKLDELIEFQIAGQTDAMLEVKAGTADYAVVDFLTASSMTGNPDYSDLMVVPDVGLSIEYDSAGFRKGSDAVEKVNEVLKKLYEDGTAAAIAEKYGLTDQAVLTEDI